MPSALLTDRALTPPAKLQAQTGLSRPTVLSCLGPARAYGTPSAGAKARLPLALLADRPVGAQAKALYGMLQASPGFRYQEGQSTYAALCAQTGLSRNTLKLAMAELSAAGWICLTQFNRLSPIRFRLVSPEVTRIQAQVDLVRRRLQRRLRPGSSVGEALMQEYLSLLIDSDRFTRAEVEEQRLRDLITAGLCAYEGIQLIIVRAPDLSLQGMLRKIGNALPLRDLTGLEPLVDLLEEESIKYAAAYKRAAMK